MHVETYSMYKVMWLWSDFLTEFIAEYYFCTLESKVFWALGISSFN